ncbi:MAG: hypothetical protein H6571_22000 [Lewinellaceae bacterium]|nr:hypothetical protein [Lewinellaceae bacterium]
MKIFFSKISLLPFFIFLFQFGNTNPLLGQVDDGMLIFQVDGNRYKRSNFNKQAKLINYQIIEVGKVKKEGEKIETKMTVITYEPDGTLRDASQTNLVCSPESKQVLMGVFPFAGKKSKRSLVVDMEDGAIMYPSGWRQLSKLNDFNFSLNFKDGVVGFFGTKSNISITNRKVMPLENSFRVSGEMSIRAYVIGIKVTSIEYKYFEEIDMEKGIIKQKFTDKIGDYFTIEILK